MQLPIGLHTRWHVARSLCTIAQHSNSPFFRIPSSKNNNNNDCRISVTCFCRCFSTTWWTSVLTLANLFSISFSLSLKARPQDYSPSLLDSQYIVSFHKHWMINPIQIYRQWFTDDLDDDSIAIDDAIVEDLLDKPENIYRPSGSNKLISDEL